MAEILRNADGEHVAVQDSAPAVNAPPGKRLVTVDVVAAKYGCDARSVFRWADGGRIPWGLKLGSLRRWDLDEIDKHIAAGCPRVRPVKGGVR